MSCGISCGHSCGISTDFPDITVTVTVTVTAGRFATVRRAAGRLAGRFARHNVASRFARNRLASGGDRFADRRKFAVRGANAAVISVITGLTEHRRRAQRRDRTDDRQTFPIFFHFYLADKLSERRKRALSTVKTRERLALLIVLSTQMLVEFSKIRIIDVFGEIYGIRKLCPV